MLQNPNKRPHNEDPAGGERPSNRPRREQSGGIANTNQAPPIFEVSVKMNSAFETFPDKLRLRLERAHKYTISHHMNGLQRGVPATSNYAFSVIRGELNGQSTARFNLQTYNFSSTWCTFANMELLRRFMREHKTPARSHKFVELRPHLGQGLVNKDFVYLHTVRAGEVGWGFDAHGCLSLYSAEIEDATLKKTVFYVERQVIKAEVIDLSED